ncbi:MAG: fluoride efflux transporter CrcB [Chlorobi bacterium]|nr:fluoride efflux transporter CrcB [Chlorobiota bacterium]
MTKLIWIFLGGGTGSLARYWLGVWLNRSEFLMPYGTFTANVLGSFLIGLSAGWMMSRNWIHTPLAYFLLIGFLGGFTTFSTFTFESLAFIRQNNWELFFAYFFSTLILGMFAVAFGFYISKLLA